MPFILELKREMQSAPVGESSVPELKLVHRGKVRDVYELDKDRLLLVATDRPGQPWEGKASLQRGCRRTGRYGNCRQIPTVL